MSGHAQLHLASVPSAPSTVRSSLDVMALPARLAEPVRLLASELVTNSVRHAGAGADAPILVTLDVDRQRLHLRVDDVGHGDVRVRSDHERTAGSGYGLFLVEALADRWGTSHTAAGTAVWFEVDLD